MPSELTQIKIDKLVYGGEGLGFLNGKACFVSHALPGETVEVEMVQSKKNFLRVSKSLEPLFSKHLTGLL